MIYERLYAAIPPQGEEELWIPKVLVCDEKHGYTYWDATTPQAFKESSLAILTNRWGQGGWYNNPDDDGLGNSVWATKKREERIKVDKLSREQILSLPEEARDVVLSLRAIAKRNDEYNQEYQEWYERAKRVVEEKSLDTVSVGHNKWRREEPEAWVLLEERSDHEYEHVELVPFCNND